MTVQDLRNSLFEYDKPVIRNFESLNTEEKMCAVLSNSATVKYTAKILHENSCSETFFYIHLNTNKEIDINM